MQFFMFLPVQVALYRINRYMGYGMVYLLMIAGIVTTFVINNTYSISVCKFRDDKYSRHLFRQPWIRIAAYQVGLLFGVLYYEWKNKRKNSVFASSYGTLLFEKTRNSHIFRYALLAFGMLTISFLPGYPDTWRERRA